MRVRASISRLGVLLVTLGLVLFVGCGGSTNKHVVEAAVSEFHRTLDEGNYLELVKHLHPDFTQKTTDRQFLDLLESIHRKLGPVQSTQETSWRIAYVGFKPDVTLEYKTVFRDGDAAETFRYRIEGDEARLLWYNINSMALVTK